MEEEIKWVEVIFGKLPGIKMTLGTKTNKGKKVGEP